MSINEKQKYPDDKEEYDRNYLRIFGRVCPVCHGTGDFVGVKCCGCKGIGYVEKEKK